MLPEELDKLLNAKNYDGFKVAFKISDVNNYSKEILLRFSDLPDEFVKWLIGHGVNIDAIDNYGRTLLHRWAGHRKVSILLESGADVNRVDCNGNTPLHYAAEAGRVETVHILLEHGARVDIRNLGLLTPLELALQQCSNSKIRYITGVAELLLPVQRQITGSRSLVSRFLKRNTAIDETISQQMQSFVHRIGTEFERFRDRFNPEFLDATSAALDKLYILFRVPPVPVQNVHEIKAMIEVKSMRWQEQHQELWDKLVPVSGAACTVQGEVIRISGCISNELDGNGGINWDNKYKQMADALLLHLNSGNSLSHSKIQDAKRVISEIKCKRGDCWQICELAVEWVILNPEPIILSVSGLER